MKKLLLIVSIVSILPLYAFAYTSPGKPQGFVSDFAHVLNTVDISSINSKLQSLKDKTRAEVAVVTITSLGDETIETYAVKLFKDWGIGQKSENNGLLILVAPNDGAVRIEVGYGLEGTITDLQSGNIIRKAMIPSFKEGKYSEGIRGGVQAVSDIIVDAPGAEVFSLTSNDSSGGRDFNYGPIVFLAIIVLNILAKILGKTKSWWLGGVLGGLAGVIIGLIWGFFYIGLTSMAVLAIIGLIFDYIVSKHPPGSGGGTGIWPIFLGGGRGGSSGGGFGGFGGGMSGGGGASGRW